MEHKELLKVPWDWQIGKMLFLVNRRELLDE